MRGLFSRIWRYLNYPADTNGKVKETWLRVRALSDSYQIKIAAIENDLRYLKTMVVALQNQLNSIQGQLRVSLPWFPSEEGEGRSPELLMLVHLASFLEDPISVDVGTNEVAHSEVLLDAGFQLYALEPDPLLTSKLRERFKDKPSLHLLGVVISEGSSLNSLAAKKEIPAHFPVLRIQAECLALEVLRGLGQLYPDIVQIELRSGGFSAATEVGPNGLALGKAVIQEMRTRGYRWNLLIFRTHGMPAIRYAANLTTTPDTSSGNLFFFKDFRLFEQAYRWSQGALPRFQHCN